MITHDYLQDLSQREVVGAGRTSQGGESRRPRAEEAAAEEDPVGAGEEEDPSGMGGGSRRDGRREPAAGACSPALAPAASYSGGTALPGNARAVSFFSRVSLDFSLRSFLAAA
jgi:hypothetical protein